MHLLLTIIPIHLNSHHGFPINLNYHLMKSYIECAICTVTELFMLVYVVMPMITVFNKDRNMKVQYSVIIVHAALSHGN
jgi:hypothetical protein